MKMSTYSLNDSAVVSVHGEVDYHSSPLLRQQIMELLGQGRRLIVDMSAVSFVDSSGIASLVEGLQYARGRQLSFALAGVQDGPMRVLHLTRLDTVFDLHASAEAAAAVGG